MLRIPPQHGAWAYLAVPLIAGLALDRFRGTIGFVQRHHRLLQVAGGVMMMSAAAAAPVISTVAAAPASSLRQPASSRLVTSTVSPSMVMVVE